MTEVRALTQSNAWRETIRLLTSPTGVVVASPRGMRVAELDERFSVRISAPQAGFVDVAGRDLNYAILAAEGASLVGQTSIPEAIVDRVQAFAKFTDDGVFWGAYGPRIAGDLGQVVSLLKRDPDTRQAVLTLYDAGHDLNRDVRDVPCTVAIQFFVRDRWLGPEPEDRAPCLDMWVVMRSNDAWLGLPYDLGQFSLLQGAVAASIGARVGTYTHSAGSMHLYERDWEAAAGVGEPRDPNDTPKGLAFGGARDIESLSRRARRILLGQGLDMGELSALDRWLIAKIGPL